MREEEGQEEEEEIDEEKERRRNLPSLSLCLIQSDSQMSPESDLLSLVICSTKGLSPYYLWATAKPLAGHHSCPPCTGRSSLQHKYYLTTHLLKIHHSVPDLTRIKCKPFSADHNFPHLIFYPSSLDSLSCCHTGLLPTAPAPCCLRTFALALPSPSTSHCHLLFSIRSLKSRLLSQKILP